MHVVYIDYINSTEVLGPGKRFVLWVSGCCFHCKGCIGESFHRLADGKIIDIDALAETINRQLRHSNDAIDGITISGGEPFLQPHALSLLISRLSPSLSVICYSGFKYEELLEAAKENYDLTDNRIPESERPYVSRFLSGIDLLIDGRYIREQDDGRALVGSSNQRIWNLSGRFSEKELSVYQEMKRRVQIVAKADRTMLIGVPDREQEAIWDNIRQRALEKDEQISF